jgi:tetratricopeptide (TPR) repeat protein
MVSADEAEKFAKPSKSDHLRDRRPSQAPGPGRRRGELRGSDDPEVLRRDAAFGCSTMLTKAAGGPLGSAPGNVFLAAGPIALRTGRGNDRLAGTTNGFFAARRRAWNSTTGQDRLMIAPFRRRTDPAYGRARTRRIRWILAFCCAATANLAASQAAELDEAAALLRTGKYEECEKEATAALEDNGWLEDWHVLKIRSQMAVGKYAEALKSLNDATRAHSASLTLYLLGRDVRRFNGLGDREEEAADRMEMYILRAPRLFATPEGQVGVGRFALLRGADPKKVLDRFYDAVIKADPSYVDAYLASAELALDKQDFGLAAETLRKAPKAAVADPRFHYLTALAFREDDREQAAKSLDEALKINPRHVDSLLLKADGLIDQERYADAAKVIDRVAAVNPVEPRAWAYRAVLAHLRGDREGEAAARRSGLEPWAGNPEVDCLIGRKLAQKYRFAEAAACQRKALELDPGYRPAKIELSETLLRLGDEAEGWKLVDEIFAADGYNVVAFNLTTLRDRLAKFRTLEADGLVVKMDPREADLYGSRVLALLKRAKATLCAKYDVNLPAPVIVEIFPEKKEFAVRTFGLPGADGFLGVCFGRVITANSPASQGETPSNWEAVLWHELCHAVTLCKTRNTMPRWLSEGISVYEEGVQDRSWGPPLNPKFRAMILGDDLTPMSQLSAAFLAPKSGLHIQFAYYESALAVEFLVQTAGQAALKGILDDLGAGKTINEALPIRTRMTLVQLDDAFRKFARGKAERVAPEVTWEEVNLPEDMSSDDLATWLRSHPKSFLGRQRLVAQLITEGKWSEAKASLLELKALYPEYVGPNNAYMMLAAVYKQASDASAEHAVLEELAGRDADASPALLRLMEIDEAAGNWSGVIKNANRLLAVNPLIAAPHRYLARAAERLGRRDEAISAYRALALLDDTDPAELHYRLAKLLSEVGKRAEARREVLKSLDEAPRFLASHRLLLELLEPSTPRTQFHRR